MRQSGRRIVAGGSLACVAAVALATAAAAQSGLQPVRLADGDSFSLGQDRYRLYGIDAPELNQECENAAGRAWPCGARARSELRRIIGTSPVQCRTLSTDRYGRNIATCHAGGRDLAEEMVRSGFATIIVRQGFTNPYEGAQAEARSGKRGLWEGKFDMPSDWRRAHPRDDRPVEQVRTPRDWLADKIAGVWKAVSGWLQSISGR